MLFRSIRVVQAFTGTTNVANTLEGVKVFPNPSHGYIQVAIPVTGSASVVTITDALGRTIETKNTEASISKASKLEIHGIPAGLYAVKVVSGSRTCTSIAEVQ